MTPLSRRQDSSFRADGLLSRSRLLYATTATTVTTISYAGLCSLLRDTQLKAARLNFVLFSRRLKLPLEILEEETS